MIEKLRNWLIRRRDQTAVSYNRFGRPGEEEDDKPPPSTILVAPFNENAPEFMLFGVCHVQKAAVYFACFGMALCILSFITTFFEFDWYSHRKGVDLGALLGLFLYLAIGVLAHYFVIYGIKRQLSRYLLPFIALYSIVCTFEVFMCLALMFKMVEPNNQIQVDAHGTSATAVNGPPYAWILLGMLVILCIQGVMLAAVLRCRQFLSQKQEHEMALKVAEKSKQEFPAIQIVLAKQTDGGNGHIPEGSSFTPPVSPPNDPEIGLVSSANPVGSGQELPRNGRPGTLPPIIPNLI